MREAKKISSGLLPTRILLSPSIITIINYDKTSAFQESYVAFPERRYGRGLCIVLRIRRAAGDDGDTSGVEGEETSALGESLAEVSEPLTRAVVFSG